MNQTIIIDHEKCTLCNKCVQICSANILKISDKKVVQTEPELCSSCGHCAAICDVDAITVSDENPLKFETKKSDENLSEIEKLLRNKRSVRKFKNQQIEKDLLSKIIEYAEKSPSSSNNRKREYIVVTDKNKILELEKAVVNQFNSLKIVINPFVIGLIKVFSKKMAKNLQAVKDDIDLMNNELTQKTFKIFRNAPAIILYLAPKKDIQSKDDCVIAQQYSMLYAESIGISSCVIGYAQYAHKSVEKILKINNKTKIFAVSTFGYNKFPYKKEINYTNNLKIKWL